MYQTEYGWKAAIRDAVTCVESKTDPKYFWGKSYEERKKHSQWINNEIRKIFPNNLSKHCWFGFCGPWIEDIWEFMEKEDFKIFGPFIPLFIPWTRMWKIKNIKIYLDWRTRIFNLLKKDYFYITICTNSHGIEGRDERKKVIPDNLLIIAGGGKGHIPTLIFMRESNPANFPINNTYEYDLMFAGKLTHRVRDKMVKFYSKKLRSKFIFHKKYINWRIEYNKAKFILAPRGFGRNSFRLGEVLQSGHVPIYVYNDIIWLPYYDSINWSSFSIVTHYSRLSQTLDRIKNTPPLEIARMRKRIIELYNSHFTVNATFNHIRRFLLGGFLESDLRCAKYSGDRGYVKSRM